MEKVAIALPVYYSWEKVPQGMHTKTQLLKMRLALAEHAQPVAIKKSTLSREQYNLYRLEDAVPMPPKRETQPKDYGAIFEKRYATPRAAYLDASNACFELNRYCKHESCTRAHQDAIYDLKNRWIAKLYREGFCIEAVKVISTREAKICYGCEGSGIDSYGEECYRCDGTGEYRPKSERVYWAFRFLVDGTQFAWHQPAPLCFDAQPIGNGIQHAVLAEVQPVSLPPRKFAEAKALIRWCLDASDAIEQPRVRDKILQVADAMIQEHASDLAYLKERE